MTGQHALTTTPLDCFSPAINQRIARSFERNWLLRYCAALSLSFTWPNNIREFRPPSGFPVRLSYGIRRHALNE